LNKRKNILIATPYINNIGGTEIEAFSTAIHLYDSNEFQNVYIFSAEKTKQNIFKLMLNTRNIKCINYPSFFSSKLVLLFNLFCNKLGCKKQLFETLFWMYWHTKVDVFFILTYPNASYFFPILQQYTKSKKYIAKITMWHFSKLPEEQRKYYKKFNEIIVFNTEQQLFWHNSQQLKNTISRDILIANEVNLLALHAVKTTEPFTFGYLGRISREKNLEDMILLIDFLNNKNQKKCQLLIQGEGDALYLNELQQLIINLDLQDSVQILNAFLQPQQTHLFYKKITVFLVTSKLEGGPMTALEAAAAGCFVMGYDIGAMKARFNTLDYIVNLNFKQLCISTLHYVNLPEVEKVKLHTNLRNYYKQYLSNSSKISNLKKLFY
jgi:glycosyltransferase involved in cell wall biosynthesis